MAPAPLFEIQGLTIEVASQQGETPLIEDINLMLRPGESIGVVGETGAGKSLSILASVGLLPVGVRPTGGTVSFNGASLPVTQPKRLRERLGRGIALLFQNARGALNPFMRVRSQIDRVLRLRLARRDTRKARMTDLMGSVGLSFRELGHKYAHQISGGQAQRVAMACALAADPRLLIADEPTTALDVTTQRDVIQLLQCLCRERGMGLILITHNLALVSQSCDRVLLMHAGHVVESGRVGEVFDQPLHPYTRGLLSAIPDVDAPHELVPLEGSVWGGAGLGGRCRFSQRCPDRWARCDTTVPSDYGADGRRVRCFLYDEGLGKDKGTR
jgi:oligopeptide/dipeptide ABC transporter ATP-binding protein